MFDVSLDFYYTDEEFFLKEKSDEKVILEKILVSEKELSGINFKWLKKRLAYRKNNLFDFNNTIYLTVDSLVDINNIMTGSNNITLRKVHVKPYEYDKMYMDKDLIEDTLYE